MASHNDPPPPRYNRFQVSNMQDVSGLDFVCKDCDADWRGNQAVMLGLWCFYDGVMLISK